MCNFCHANVRQDITAYFFYKIAGKNVFLLLTSQKI